MLPVKALVALRTIPVAPVTSVGPMSIPVPMYGRSPMAACPDPVVIAQSPTSTDPDVPWRRTDRHGFHDRRRHGWLHINRRLCHDHGCWYWHSNVNSKADTSVCVYSGKSHHCQSQDCDCLFHNVYQFDVVARPNIVTTGLLFCKPRGVDRIREPAGKGPKSRKCTRSVDETTVSG